MAQAAAPVAMEFHEIAHYWNQFSKSFDVMAGSMRSLGLALLQQSGAVHAHRILEVGCGGGETAQQFTLMGRQDAELIATDLAEDMVAIAKERVKDHRVKFTQANAEKLAFPDEHFDAYYACHVVHITTNPDVMLREAHRVLKRGSCAALSVWGRQENTPTFTIVGAALKELNIPIVTPSRRSNFHLNDPAALRAMALKAGFSQAVTYFTSTPLPMLMPAEEKAEILLRGPGHKTQLASMTEEQRVALRKAVIDRLNADMAAGIGMNHEALVLVVRK